MQLQAAVPDSNQTLILNFSQHGDRFATSVLLNSSDQVLLAESIEGSADEGMAAWPRSSPLQEILPQTIDGLDLLAGIGMAGKSHWSVIVKPLLDRPGFDFEFACRVKESPDFLGSTYRLPSRADNQSVRLRAESTDAVIQVEDEQLVIRPEIGPDIAFPSTVQWQYQLVLDV